MMSREEALAIYHAGPEAVVEVLCQLSLQVELLQKQVVALQQRVEGLEAQIAKNSSNSSKPPSSDGLSKPKPRPRSLRKKSGRKPGGQKGHKGHTLKMVEKPNHIIVHSVVECEKCCRSLKNVSPTETRRRQEFDVPPPKPIEVTEHQTESKKCPGCGHLTKALFPKHIKAPTQYGSRIKAIVTYLREYQLLPSERTGEMLVDLFSLHLSEGTQTNILCEASDILKESVEEIACYIASATVAHFDESGVRVNGKRQWLHTASTPDATFYGVHQKRGNEATNDIGVLPQFTGTAVHDHWKPYFKYDCDHSLCNAHHLRELKFVHEINGQQWAKEMIDCLLEMKQAVDEQRDKADRLDNDRIIELEDLYYQVIESGYSENPLPDCSRSGKKRGRVKKSKSLNLLERLNEYWVETLAFMYNFAIPFDNNLAERDIRMIKVQQKISGCFRSEVGAMSFCRIRSYISTVKKRTLSIMESLRSAFQNKPFMLLGMDAG